MMDKSGWNLEVDGISGICRRWYGVEYEVDVRKLRMNDFATWFVYQKPKPGESVGQVILKSKAPTMAEAMKQANQYIEDNKLVLMEPKHDPIQVANCINEMETTLTLLSNQ